MNKSRKYLHKQRRGSRRHNNKQLHKLKRTSRSKRGGNIILQLQETVNSARDNVMNNIDEAKLWLATKALQVKSKFQTKVEHPLKADLAAIGVGGRRSRRHTRKR